MKNAFDALQRVVKTEKKIARQESDKVNNKNKKSYFCSADSIKIANRKAPSRLLE